MGIFCSTLQCNVATGVCCTLLFLLRVKECGEREKVVFLSAIVKGLIYHLTMEVTVCG